MNKRLVQNPQHRYGLIFHGDTHKLLGGDVGDVGDRVHDRGVVNYASKQRREMSAREHKSKRERIAGERRARHTQDVDSTEFGDDGLDNSLAASLVSDVLGDTETNSSSSLDQSLGLVGVDLLLGKLKKVNQGRTVSLSA